MNHVELFPERGAGDAGCSGRWYWREVAGNGETVGVSEAYSTKSNAKRAARKFRSGLEIKEVLS